MDFFRCHIHITRPGQLYRLQVPSFGAMAHWIFRGSHNTFSIGGANDDMLQVSTLAPHHIHGLIEQATIKISTNGPVQFIFPNNQQTELTNNQTTSFPIVWNTDTHSFRWKMVIGEVIIRIEILQESENIPVKLHKYLEMQYGRMTKIQEGRSCLIYKTTNSQIIKLLRPSHAKNRGVMLRFINAARKFCVFPEHLFLRIEEIVYRRELLLAYVVVQHFPGETLENYLARRGILLPTEAVYLIRMLAQNLLIFQRHQCCCRNLTPENILIDEMHRLRITGFFLLKSQEHNVTMPGAQMVIPKYTAPEQVDHPMMADIYADIFSLGAIFYQMLLGEPPLNFNQARQYVEFLKAGKGILAKDIKAKAPILSSQLCELISSMLSLDKNKRPSPEQLLAHLSDHHLAMTQADVQEEAVWESNADKTDGMSPAVVFEDEQDDPEALIAAHEAPLFIPTNQRKSFSPKIDTKFSPSAPLVSKPSAPLTSKPSAPLASKPSAPLASKPTTLNSTEVTDYIPLSEEPPTSNNTKNDMLVAQTVEEPPTSNNTENDMLVAQVVEESSTSDNIENDMLVAQVTKETPTSNKNKATKTGTPTTSNTPKNTEELNLQENEIMTQSFELEENKSEESASYSALIEFDQGARLPAQSGDHGYTLKVIQGPESSRPFEYHFKGDRQIVIGREADFSIRNDTLISRAHARLEMIEGDWWVTDLRSRNGVIIEGRKISREKIAPGTEFTVGETTLRFQKNTTASEILEDQDLPEATIASAREIRITRMYPVLTPQIENSIPPAKNQNTTSNTTVPLTTSNTTVPQSTTHEKISPTASIPAHKKPISSTLIRRPPRPHEDAPSSSWPTVSHADDADKVLNEVYQEFQETAIRSNSHSSHLVQFNDGSLEGTKKIIFATLVFLIVLVLLILVFFLFFLDV